jgi:hypothetical protein
MTFTTAPSGRLARARTPRRRSAATWAHLPDPEQRLLLRAAIDGSDVGLAAWSRWLGQADPDLDRFDTGSERLLPLVYSSLSRQHAELPGRELLSARYRRSWYTHNVLLHRAKPAWTTLLEAGHAVMVVKGVSLAERYYDDRGARKISDVDVVVREEEAAAALDVLLRSGWSCGDPDIPAEVLFERSHAVGLVDGNGGQLDLHRRMLYLSRGGLDGPVWDRAEPTKFDNVTVLTPCAADELLLTIVHGWAWSAVSSIRWIPDAAAIVPHLDTDGWQTLIDESRRRQVSYRLWTALRAAHDQYDVAVPTWVLEDLARGPFASFEASEERWHTTAHRRVPPGVFAYYEHVRQVGSPNGPTWWVDFARYYASLVSGPEGRNPVKWSTEKLKRRLARRGVR